MTTRLAEQKIRDSRALVSESTEDELEIVRGKAFEDGSAWKEQLNGLLRHNMTRISKRL